MAGTCTENFMNKLVFAFLFLFSSLSLADTNFFSTADDEPYLKDFTLHAESLKEKIESSQVPSLSDEDSKLLAHIIDDIVHSIKNENITEMVKFTNYGLTDGNVEKVGLYNRLSLIHI